MNQDLEALLAYLREVRGFDFTGYKLSSLERRLRRRMETVDVDTYDAYREHLEVHPSEFRELFNTILINVTAFFRDPDAWEAIRTDILPALLTARDDEEPLRVWSAGCASGQEAYTAAMLLCEAMGEEAFLRRVKIYGTDIDEEALDEARQALYDASDLEAVPAELRERYFEPLGHRFCFRKDLRRSMIFGRNNVLQDAPISRIDLLLCRNTLMYFTAETQHQILRRLHFALQPTGFLFLGKSEMLLTRRDMFAPVDLKRRIFTKVVKPGERQRVPLLPALDELGAADSQTVAAAQALDAGPVPQIVIGRDRSLVVANDAARRVLRLGPPDIGRPLQDLEVSYRPTELRGAIDQAFDEGRSSTLGPVAHRRENDELFYEVQVTPLAADGAVAAAGVTFIDVTARHLAEQEVLRARRELGAAYEELQSTVEELETTNEELQSTNEELETTNEELQSTNEELETMNEELQSTNEELETMNDEMRVRSFELQEGNAVMDAVLRAKGVAVIVVDRDERVRGWSRQSEELWGLRSEEVVGEPVIRLDIGLPLEAVRPAMRAVLLDGSGPERLRLAARDRRGRDFECVTTVLPLQVDGQEPAAVVLLTERDDPA